MPGPGGVPSPGGREVPGPEGSGLGGLLPGVETPPSMATTAGGTHPTGMHSCLISFLHLYNSEASQ